VFGEGFFSGVFLGFFGVFLSAILAVVLRRFPPILAILKSCESRFGQKNGSLNSFFIYLVYEFIFG
jgi:hypothetical protein